MEQIKIGRHGNQQIKIFEGLTSNEQTINEWLRENPDVVISSIHVDSLHQLYHNQPPQVASQWTIIIVVYEERKQPECEAVQIYNKVKVSSPTHDIRPDDSFLI